MAKILNGQNPQLIANKQNPAYGHHSEFDNPNLSFSIREYQRCKVTKVALLK